MSTRPSLSQHKGLFKHPYLEDFAVSTVDDLLNLTFPHKDKICWVIDKKCWYYLYEETDSPTLNSWKPITAPGEIRIWDAERIYLNGETVYYNSQIALNKGKGIYVAFGEPTKGLNPLQDPEHWICISDDSNVLEIQISNASSFIFNQSSKGFKYMYQVFEKTDNGFEQVLVTPTITITDEVETTTFDFFENQEPYLFTGILRIIA